MDTFATALFDAIQARNAAKSDRDQYLNKRSSAWKNANEVFEAAEARAERALREAIRVYKGDN